MTAWNRRRHCGSVGLKATTSFYVPVARIRISSRSPVLDESNYEFLQVAALTLASARVGLGRSFDTSSAAATAQSQRHSSSRSSTCIRRSSRVRRSNGRARRQQHGHLQPPAEREHAPRLDATRYRRCDQPARRAVRSNRATDDLRQHVGDSCVRFGRRVHLGVGEDPPSRLERFDEIPRPRTIHCSLRGVSWCRDIVRRAPR